MNKNDLVLAVADKLELDATSSRAALNAVTGSIIDAIAGGDKVTITGFGTFMPVARKEREARNPINGERIHVPAKTAVVFRAGTDLRERVNGGSDDGTGDDETF